MCLIEREIRLYPSRSELRGITFKNKYGIYIKDGNMKNTFISNRLIENNITSHDSGGNYWLENAENADGISR
jgi:hypothetical protein